MTYRELNIDFFKNHDQLNVPPYNQYKMENHHNQDKILNISCIKSQHNLGIYYNYAHLLDLIFYHNFYILLYSFLNHYATNYNILNQK